MIEVILASVVIVETVILLAVVIGAERRKGSVKMHDAKSPAAEKSTSADPATMPHLSEADLEQLKSQARTAFQKAVDDSATTFHADLQATSDQLNKLIVRITTDVVETELEEYRKSLQTAREQALASLQNMQTAVDAKRKDLEADLDSELVKRRQHLSERLDQKLGAAVAAYIVESLGQGADLGAQRGFMLESLERHREELKKEIENGA